MLYLFALLCILSLLLKIVKSVVIDDVMVLFALLDRAIMVHPTYRSHVEPSFYSRGDIMIDKILDNQDIMGLILCLPLPWIPSC